MDGFTKEDKISAFDADFICSKCEKPINGHKHLKIGKRMYHMTCGMKEAIKEGKIKQAN
jgi:hypothetical protein